MAVLLFFLLWLETILTFLPFLRTSNGLRQINFLQYHHDHSSDEVAEILGATHDATPFPMFKSVQKTGVIFATSRARAHGFTATDPTWANMGQVSLLPSNEFFCFVAKAHSTPFGLFYLSRRERQRLTQLKARLLATMISKSKTMRLSTRQPLASRSYEKKSPPITTTSTATARRASTLLPMSALFPEAERESPASFPFWVIRRLVSSTRIIRLTSKSLASLSTSPPLHICIAMLIVHSCPPKSSSIRRWDAALAPSLCRIRPTLPDSLSRARTSRRTCVWHAITTWLF